MLKISEYCDILRVLQQAKADMHKIRDVMVVGMIDRYINGVPVNLGKTEIASECALVSVSIYAVKFLRNDPVKGEKNPEGMYLATGEFLAFIDKNARKPEKDICSFTGTLALGEINRKGSTYTIMHTFKKGTNGWRIVPTQVSDVDARWFYGDGKSQELINYLLKSNDVGHIVVPQELMALPARCTSATKIQMFDSVTAPANVQSVQEEKPSTQQTAPQPEPQETAVQPLKSSMKGFLDRTRPVEASDVYNTMSKDMRELVHTHEKSVKNLVKACKHDTSDEDEEEVSKYVSYMLDSLRKFWDMKPYANTGSTGRALLKEYLCTDDRGKAKNKDGIQISDEILAHGQDLLGYIEKGGTPSLSPLGRDLYKDLFKDKEVMYAGILARVLKVSTRELMECAESCKDKEIWFSVIANEKPYNLILLTDISFKSVETIALATGKAGDDKYLRQKYVGLLHEYTLKSDGDGRTLYTEQDIMRGDVSIALSTKEYEMLRTTGSILSRDTVANILAYMYKAEGKVDMGYDLMTFNPNEGKNGRIYGYRQRVDRRRLKLALEDFISSGLGYRQTVDGNAYIINSVQLRKELFVYEKLRELCSHKKFDSAKIDSLVDEFEAMKATELGISEFKLEDKQREACHLAGEGVFVVTGPAGGGKTTVAECIIYVCKKLYGDSFTVEFATPTGKASKRLQEVIGERVYTMHSKFCIFGNKNSMSAVEEAITEGFKYKSEPDMFVFDEVAMANIDLIFSVLTRISKAKICFLGDINQLPPIGKGLPFRNMLLSMPCVTLNVCKRSAEGSNVTRNSKRINEKSTPVNFEPLEDALDYRNVVCADDAIPVVLRDLIGYYLGDDRLRGKLEKEYFGTEDSYILDLADDITPNDIQIVSPMGKPTKTWGTARLNRVLQDLFVPRGTRSVYHVLGGNVENAREFRIGDRVIHLDNNYEVQHYTMQGTTVFPQWNFSITNGDVGYVQGIYKTSDLVFADPLEPQPDDWEETLGNRQLRMESTWDGDDKALLAVEYTDCDGGKFIIFYRVRVLDSSTLDTGRAQVTGNEQFVTSMDLMSLDLAYALTVHKLQGSQAKLIIFTLGNFQAPKFLTRNLIYTAITRASKGCICVGDVGADMSSSLNKARMSVAHDGIPTVGELII